MGNKSTKKPTIIDTDDFKFLKDKTKFDEKTLEIFHAGFIQDSVDGKMSKEEFCKKFQGTFCAGQNQEEFSSHIFKALDTDMNGFIDFRKTFSTNNTFCSLQQAGVELSLRQLDWNLDLVM